MTLELSSLVRAYARQPVPVERVALSGEREWLLHRLDRVYPYQCGNKGPKVFARLAALKAAGCTGVVTVGGAFSNHLHALAAIGAQLGLRTAAMVRGLDADLGNPTLADAARWGMTLRPVQRSCYAERGTQAFQRWVGAQFPGYAFIAEGACDDQGVAACEALARQLNLLGGDVLVVPVGTGATLTGLRRGLDEGVAILAADVVTHPDRRRDCLRALRVQWVDARFGGYGTVSDPLLSWLSRFFGRTGVLLDPLYNGKAAYWCDQQRLARVHLLHTGGVQGWRGLAARGRLHAHAGLHAASENLRF